MKIFRSAIIPSSIVVACGVFTTSAAFAAEDLSSFPNKPVTMIVSFPPGGSSDFFTRLVANGLSKKWNQPVVVENRPGGGGNIGAQLAARAPADGYTLYMSSINTHGINPGLYKNLGYDPLADFTPISRIATVTNVLVVNPSLPVNNVSELLDYFKKNPKKAFYASPGAGTSPHLSSELFKRQTNSDLTHVPYKGSTPALTDVMAGNVPVAIDNLPAAIGNIQGGNLRALAVTSTTRSPELPDVPTMEESGVEGYNVTSWWGLFGRAGTPEAIISKVNQDVVALLNEEETQRIIAAQGAQAAPSTPEELGELVESEVSRWTRVIKEANISLE